MADHSSCGWSIKQIHDALERQSNSMLQSQNLTMAQVSVLLTLEEAIDHQMPLKELEKELKLAQSTTTGIVSRLEQKGFVESYTDAKDRRVKLIKLTQAGKDCCHTAEENMCHAEEALLRGLTETERQIFKTMLDRVRSTL